PLAVLVVTRPYRHFAVTDAERQATSVIIPPRQRQPDLIGPFRMKLLPDFLLKLVDAFQLVGLEDLRRSHALPDDFLRQPRLPTFIDVLEARRVVFLWQAD